MPNTNVGTDKLNVLLKEEKIIPFVNERVEAATEQQIHIHKVSHFSLFFFHLLLYSVQLCLVCTLCFQKSCENSCFARKLVVQRD
jgi:hypothetical protein